MAKKTKKPVLDAASLGRLGVERLAGLLLEAASEDAALKRTLTFEIAIAEDPAAALREMSKRVASLARAKSFLDWRKTRDFARELDGLRASIAGRLGEVDPAGAYELLWSFLDTAAASQNRCDDSSGSVGGVYATALRDSAGLAIKAAPDPVATAARIGRAVESNDYGQFDDVITLYAPVLGGEGQRKLREGLRKALTEAEDLARRTPPPEARRVHGVVYVSAIDMEAFRPSHRVRTLRHALQEIADIEGDVDTYIAMIEPDERTAPGIASGIARRLLAAGRPVQALAAIDAVETAGALHFADRTDDIRFDILDALDRGGEAQQGRWDSFLRALNARHLKDHLARLPDFEDFEAERRALDHAEAFEDAHRALHFLIGWPDLERAARLVKRRHDGWDGDLYELLSPSADVLEERYPLAATILRRAMIDFTLGRARSSRYGHAARHLRECQALRSRIQDYAPVVDHEAYAAHLRRAHGRKSGFWSLMN